MRWKWLIMGSVVLALLIGLLFTLLATPTYTATTRIEINREGARIVNIDDVEPETTSVDMEFYQTQYGILNSRSLAERVARELRLAENAEFFEHFGETDAADSLTDQARASSERSDRFSLAVDILLEQVEIAPIRLSRLVDIHWSSPDPLLSARVANAWATGFIEHNLERRFEATAYARRFLEQRLGQLRRRLEESERQLVGYASNQAIINIPVGGQDAQGRAQERSLTVDRLAALNAQLAEAIAERIEAQSGMGGEDGANAEALSNTTLAALRQRQAEAAAEHSRLLTQFEPGYPAVQALAAQIKQLDESIAREEQRVQDALSNAFQNSQEREQGIASRIEGLKQNYLDQRRRSIQYNIFQREVDTSRQLYDGLLQRYKEIGIAGGVGENNVSIVDLAKIPDEPSYPRPALNLLLALLVGTLVGAGLALLCEQIDETIVDPSDLEGRIGIPLLGAVPKSKTDDPSAELKDLKSDMIEAYLSVYTGLGFSTDHGIPKTLSVTSTRPAEGKSTTAYALAYISARNGSRTLLVDADMRSPSLHGQLGLENEKGLSNFLSGADNLDMLIQKPAGEPFYVLLAGPQPPNAAELLRGDRLTSLMADFASKFDHVIIDMPPVMGLADAPIIASRTEGTIFVVEARAVKGRMARLALDRLRQGRATLLGSVLTKFEAKRAGYGYGYYYGYGYGEDRAEPKMA